MKKASFIIVVIALVVGAIFFIPSRLSHIEEGSSGDKPLVSGRARLQSKSWEWINTTYGDGTTHEPRQPGQFVLTLTPDGRFSAHTDCNSTGGNYVADDHMFSFSDIVATKMYCEGSVENDFVKTLMDTQSYFFTETGDLVFDFKFDSGSAVFK